MKLATKSYIVITALSLLLPLLLILPNWSSTFFGSDFIFPFNRINELGYPLRLWTSDYFGDRNFAAYGIPVLLLAKLSVSLGGSLHAPHFFIYITLAAYLFSIGLLVRLVRELFSSEKQDEKHNNIFLYDGLLVVMAFLSPVVLGYFANYFTVGILLATVGVILSLRSLLKFIIQNDQKSFLHGILWTLLIVHPPTFFFYVGVTPFLLFGKSKKSAVFFFLFALAINSLWLIPLALSFLSPDVVSLSADVSYIDHIFNWYGKSSNILVNSLFSIYPNNKLFRVIPIYIFAFIYGLAYLGIFYALSKTSNGLSKVKRITFLSLLTALFVVFAFSYGGKYGTGVFFRFLWTHVSALHFFKSFTQILNVGFVIFLSIFAASLVLIKHSKLKTVATAAIAIACLVIGIFHVPRLNSFIARGTIPGEYWQLRTMVDSDPTESRVLNLPEINYEFYNWNKNWDQHFVTQKWLSRPIVSFGIVVPSIARNLYPSDRDFTKLFKENNFRYLLVHHDYGNEVFKPKEFVFDYSIVDLIESNQYFDLFKIKEAFFTPRITSTNVTTFKRINSLRYQIQLTNATTSTKLTLLEKFDPGWRIVPASGTGACESRNGASGILNQMFRTSLADESHVIAQGFANQWTIDPEDIRRGYSSEYYERNQEGGMDTCLTLFFKPQLYLYLSAFISSLSLLGLVAYFLALTKKNTGRHYEK